MLQQKPRYAMKIYNKISKLVIYVYRYTKNIPIIGTTMNDCKVTSKMTKSKEKKKSESLT